MGRYVVIDPFFRISCSQHTRAHACPFDGEMTMATSQPLPVLETPDIGALNRSLSGLKAMGSGDPRNKIAVIDRAWDESNNSVVATSRSTGQSYKETLMNLSRSPVKRISESDPRVMAYSVALSDIADARAEPTKGVQHDDATRAAQERAAMKRLDRNPTDEQGMSTLVTIAQSEIARDITRTRQAQKDAKANEAR